MATTKKSATAKDSHYDSRVDTYVNKSAAFAQPILTHIRALVHRAYPDAVETIKWGHPFFTAPTGKTICNMAAFKQHCACGIWNAEVDAQLKASGVDVEGSAGSLGRLTSVKDLPADKKLMGYIATAAKEAAAGKPTMRPAGKPQPRTEIEMPADLAAALKKSKSAAKTYEAFTPSCKREYLTWITEAKREETRTKRIATAVAQMAEGKKLNWKYENC